MAAAGAQSSPAASAAIPLSMLNRSTVKIGTTWEVVIWDPFEDKYEYDWKGRKRQGTNFICTLVYAADPRQYCQAHFKKTVQNEKKYDEALKKNQAGARFKMSKVAFVEDAKAAYVSAPLKTVVDLSGTTMELCIGIASSAVQPAPEATIAASSGLASNQFFDVTALVQEVQEPKPHENNRSSFVIKIHDASLDKDTQKVKVMPVRVFFNTENRPNTRSQNAGRALSGEGIKALAEKHLQEKKALSFFAISGSQDDKGKFSFRTSKNTMLFEAVGEKAESLNNDAALHSLQIGDTTAFELQEAKGQRDWSLEASTETACKLLSTFARTSTGVPELDEKETLWQLNFVEVTEPSQDQKVKSNDGTRLWFPVTLRDHSGTIMLYITEAAALKLANVADMSEFEQLFSENRLRFPFLASVKVWRRPSKLSAVQSDSTQTQQDKDDFDCFIVDASEQDLAEVQSLHSTLLLPMLANSVDNVVLATLEMIRKTDHYSMAVEYITQEMPAELSKTASKVTVGIPMLRNCARVIALVQSTKPSKLSDAGTGGHKLVTDNVCDYVSTSSNDAQKHFTVTSFCTLDTVTDFKLNPPSRGKNQVALIVVSGVIATEQDSVQNLLVDNVLLLTPHQAEALKPKFKQLLCFAALAAQLSKKRELEPWSPEQNPSKALKCRALSRSPTGPALPEYSA